MVGRRNKNVEPNTQLSLVDGGYLTDKQLFALENWMLQGKNLAHDLKAHGKDTEKGEGQLLWELGDWLIHGEVHGKLGKLKLRRTATAATGYKWSYLKNLKVVSRAIPSYRRRNGLSYSIHREVCPADEATQERLLTDAAQQQAKGTPISVREIRKEVRKQIGSIGIKGSKLAAAKTGGTGEVVKIELSMQNYNYLDSLLNDFSCGGRYMVGDLMFDIVANYVKQHSAEIKARRAAHQSAMEQWNKTQNSPERKAYVESYMAEKKKWEADCLDVRKQRAALNAAGKGVGDSGWPQFPPAPKWIPEDSSSMTQKPFLPGMEEYFATPSAAAKPVIPQGT